MYAIFPLQPKIGEPLPCTPNSNSSECFYTSFITVLLLLPASEPALVLLLLLLSRLGLRVLVAVVVVVRDAQLLVPRQPLQVLLRQGHALDLLHSLALGARHDARRAADHARQADEEARRPRRPVVPVQRPHERAQADLERRVGELQPDDAVQLPQLGRRRPLARERHVGDRLQRVRDLGDVEGAGRLVDVLGPQVRGQRLRPLEAEPAPVDARQGPQRLLVLAEAVLEQVVRVAEPPGREAEPRHAEQRVQDLRIGLYPYPARRVDVVAVAVVAHGGCCVAEQQEEHAAPGDDVERVYGEEEAEPGVVEFPEGDEAHRDLLLHGVLGREVISVGIFASLDVGGGDVRRDRGTDALLGLGLGNGGPLADVRNGAIVFGCDRGRSCHFRGAVFLSCFQGGHR